MLTGCMYGIFIHYMLCLCMQTEHWSKLEVLNMCRNKLTVLPSLICKLESLRRLMVNENQLDFEGIPSGIGKIVGLEVFSAAHNRLEMIPEGLCRYVFFLKEATVFS